MTGTRNRVSNYFNVNLGKIVKSLGKEAPEDMTGVTERTNKDGIKVYEIQSDYIAGKIVHLELQQPQEGKEDYGAQVAITLEADSGEKAVVNAKWDSAYMRGFMFSIPNADLAKPVELEPYQYYNKNKGRDVSGLNIFQEGTQLEWAYGTKKNPGGMPELKEVTFKGKKTWDNTDQLEFLTKKFEALAQEVKALNLEVNDPSTVTADQDSDDEAGDVAF